MTTTTLDTVYVTFNADISPKTAESLVSTCAELANKRAKTIYLLLSTPGGNVNSGVYIYNMLRAMPCKIVTHNVGSIDSIGNAVFLAGSERYAVPGSTFMFHGAAAEFNAAAKLDERGLLENVAMVQIANRRIAEFLRDRCSFTEDGAVEKLFLQAATYDAQTAKRHGIIHEIRDAKIPEGGPIVPLVFQR